jgi:hypothetical protein
MTNNITNINTGNNLKFEKTNGNNFQNYFLVVIIILFEDSPFFLIGAKQIFWLIIFILLWLYNAGKKNILNKKIFLVMFAAWGLIIIQAIIYGAGLSPAALYKPLLVFYTPFLVFTLMGVRYYKYLFNVIYFIAVYTFIIYLLHTFSPPFYDWLLYAFKSVFPYSWADWPRTILIYSHPRESGFFFMRNSGIFHEPGAYSIYLMLAIIINTFLTRKPLHKKNVFLIIVLLTTFSTAGYLMLFVFLSYAVIKLNIHFALKPTIIIPVGVLLINVYQESIFLGNKVEQQYEIESKALEKGVENRGGRFYSIGISLRSIASAPFAGRGILAVNKYDVGESGRYGYGFPGMLAMYGVLFGIFYIWFFYKGFITMSKIYQMPKLYAITAFIVINLGLLTQAFFLNISFVFFFIIGLFVETEKISNQQIVLNKQN